MEKTYKAGGGEGGKEKHRRTESTPFLLSWKISTLRWLRWSVGLVLKHWFTPDFRKIIFFFFLVCLVLADTLCRGHLITLSSSLKHHLTPKYMLQKFMLFNTRQLKLKKWNRTQTHCLHVNSEQQREVKF